jgi:hypothetical protein
MRKFILISALLLASATAQAGESRSLILAANDIPSSSEKIQSAQPVQPKAEVQPEASQPLAEAPKPAVEAAKPVAETPKPAEASRPVKAASRPAHKADADNYADAEAKARRIAARYGVSW